MTDADKGAAKNYIELRITHFKKITDTLEQAGPIVVAQPAREFLDMGIRYHTMIIQELEGVARHLKIELWTTNEGSKNLKSE